MLVVMYHVFYCLSVYFYDARTLRLRIQSDIEKDRNFFLTIKKNVILIYDFFNLCVYYSCVMKKIDFFY